MSTMRLKRISHLFVLLIGLTLLPAFVDTPRVSAGVSVATCQGQIPQGMTPSTASRPFGYYVDWTIDNEPSDNEYVFMFNPSWTVNGVEPLVWAGSQTMRNLANGRWGGTLGAYACGRPILVYADKVGVDWFGGGVNHWMSNLVIYKR